MSYIVSITSQGQISIPIKIRRELNLDKTKRAIVSVDKGNVVIHPVQDLMELAGSLKTNKKPISPRKMREAFGQYLAEEAINQ
ncbi:hypothetical protein A3A93_05425 [Candidatus Roizmanbacteria bacterium RIFCSPLOWO2_01_FULL_38_12]|uniref:SpoVT-AbrB domain-containing protein n=1 Tax=Candidatus Roizmanbacteria bacterium RIFCSPLOWO2_01_FULL_38_12 TaxID=1802061 RepID=A0A1F7IZ40_9BACT|nr:MAG: hypothetical protein A2861_03640 [Candidatus Roizmanbacteria bacterium RIFCSPHIGHO2_01_FULL_38_15]OGK35661.1 MAG: hypothetical protein A3F59_01855 [Candidatus Roizmanbacteria bacterium RIFCSPHIGHO2_12_FULL_38_13]OGK48627.1 MAG: hypothetical protein A3A93_05425 [Candidatus Roizmanbacteria bacterium RIFCSPLOWO2_01_FULL_38_12]